MKGETSIRQRCNRCYSRHNTMICPHIWRSYDVTGRGSVTALVYRSCYNCAADSHFGDNCPFPRGSPLKYGDPSAFGEDMLSTIDRNGNVIPSSGFSESSQYQLSTSRYPSSRKPQFSSLDSSRKKPTFTGVDEEDDWFSRRWRKSGKQLESRRDAAVLSHEREKPQALLASSPKQLIRSKNYQLDEQNAESTHTRSNGDVRRRIDRISEEIDWKQKRESLHVPSSRNSQRNRFSKSMNNYNSYEDIISANKIGPRSREVTRVKRDPSKTERRYNGSYF